MKVLIVSTVPLEKNGIAAVIMNLYRTLKEDIQFDFLVHKNANTSYQQEIISQGSTLIIVDRKRNTINYVRLLYLLLKNNKYDVIHVHGNSALMTLELLIAKMMGVKKRIAHCHSTECDHVCIHSMLKKIFTKVYTEAIACSEEAGNWIFGKNKFTVVDNGINVEKYKYNINIRESVRCELSLESDFIIGNIGLFNTSKNHERLFSIFAYFKKNYPASRLLCISGDKEIPNYIIECLERQEIKDDVIILLDRDDIQDLLQAMDFFVFPSKHEGLGIVAIEAQASGLFCLASDNVPTKIDITDNVKHLSLDEPDEKWADEINRHIKDKIDRESMNQIVMKSGFNIKSVSSKMRSIYER